MYKNVFVVKAREGDGGGVNRVGTGRRLVRLITYFGFCDLGFEDETEVEDEVEVKDEDGVKVEEGAGIVRSSRVNREVIFCEQQQ